MSPAGGVACFLLEPIGITRYSLRRYAGGSKCAFGHGYHNAVSGVVAERPDPAAPPGDPFHGVIGRNPPEVARDDPRWPQRCECGYAFTEADTWQVWADGLYSRVDTGQVMTWAEAPAGAIREASWWPDKGADDKAWVVKLPDGSEWMTEGKAGNCNCNDHPAHRCWQRTGSVPALTVSPSIQTPSWHGFLRAGRLLDA